MGSVVFDTNVYISALITRGGSAEKAYLRAVEGKVRLYASIPILTELAKKLKEKFFWEDEEIADAVKHIGSVAAVLKPPRSLSVLTDGPDNRILECAQEAGAEWIVTGDKHLLKLGTYEGIKIMTIAEFLRIGPKQAE